MAEHLPFAFYGTLRWACGGALVFSEPLVTVQRGHVQGYTLKGGRPPFAVPHEGSSLVVDVVTPTTEYGYADEMLEVIDRIEGHGLPWGSYERIAVPAEVENGGLRTCWMYVARPSVQDYLRNFAPLESGDWLSVAAV